MIHVTIKIINSRYSSHAGQQPPRQTGPRAMFAAEHNHAVPMLGKDRPPTEDVPKGNVSRALNMSGAIFSFAANIDKQQRLLLVKELLNPGRLHNSPQNEEFGCNRK
jgi:hypothetical protein